MPHCELNGASIWYDDWSGAGEPILLHHGYTASRENWGYDGASRRRRRSAEVPTAPSPRWALLSAAWHVLAVMRALSSG